MHKDGRGGRLNVTQPPADVKCLHTGGTSPVDHWRGVGGQQEGQERQHLDERRNGFEDPMVANILSHFLVPSL